MMKTTGKTLAELDVQPGDVVRDYAGYTYVLAQNKGGEWCDAADNGALMAEQPIWRIVSRAQLDAQIAELAAQRDALPKVVRLYCQSANGNLLCVFSVGSGATHYRDFTLINGVPEGFTKIASQSDCAEVEK